MQRKIHQVLHGYSDGHRMIAGSLSLSSAEARTMVVMSDLSGAGVRPGSSGYLTGYPLEGSGRYVLARTWAAPEMPRPGCVWTHSLVIENADIATLTSSDDLLDAFRRPAGLSAKGDYVAPIDMPVGPLRPPRVRGRRARSVLNAIYAASTEQVVASAEDSDEDEALICAIWMQQWPRLRRAFSFCTLAGMDRSSKAVRLDVQFVPGMDRSSRSRFPGAVLPQEVGRANALDTLGRDLEGEDGTKLREFLRRTGGDVDGGRRAMVPLCALHMALFSGDPPDLVTAIGALESLGKSQARSVRLIVVKHAIERIAEIEDEVFDFVIEAIKDGVVSDWILPSQRNFVSLWRKAPTRFFDIIDLADDFGEQLVHVLRYMPLQFVLQGVGISPEISSRVVSVRPDLMESADFWRGPGASLDLLDNLDNDRCLSVASALIEAGIEASASVLLSRLDGVALASILERMSDGPLLGAWLMELTRDLNRLAAVLASSAISRRKTLVAIARCVHPDAVPNDYGDDPWVVAVAASCASGNLEQADEDFLAAFLMSRALGTKSRSRAELMRQSYTVVYRALEHVRLPQQVESLVTPRLNWGGWFGWDECRRLRETVVQLFISNHLDHGTFGRLTNDGKLAFALIDEAARSEQGRRYLAEVRRTLKHSEEKAMGVRADYIAKKIK